MKKQLLSAIQIVALKKHFERCKNQILALDCGWFNERIVTVCADRLYRVPLRDRVGTEITASRSGSFAGARGSLQ
jgi:hypothetical protein